MPELYCAHFSAKLGAIRRADAQPRRACKRVACRQVFSVHQILVRRSEHCGIPASKIRLTECADITIIRPVARQVDLAKAFMCLARGIRQHFELHPDKRFLISCRSGWRIITLSSRFLDPQIQIPSTDLPRLNPGNRGLSDGKERRYFA